MLRIFSIKKFGFLPPVKDWMENSDIYKLFKDNLNPSLLAEFNRKLNIEGSFNKYLK